MNNKKGLINTEETLELILGGAAVFVLFALFFMILAPSFNRPEQAAKSYASILEKELKNAEAGINSSIEISKGDSGGEVYIVYFNNQYGLRIGESILFNPYPDGESISSCYISEGKDNKCFYVRSSYPARIIDEGFDNGAAWYFGKGNKYSITLENKEYVFKKIM